MLIKNPREFVKAFAFRVEIPGVRNQSVMSCSEFMLSDERDDTTVEITRGVAVGDSDFYDVYNKRNAPGCQYITFVLKQLSARDGRPIQSWNIKGQIVAYIQGPWDNSDDSNVTETLRLDVSSVERIDTLEAPKKDWYYAERSVWKRFVGWVLGVDPSECSR